MDINCVSDCAHQHDGKCGLTEIPQGTRFRSGKSGSGSHDENCPYYMFR